MLSLPTAELYVPDGLPVEQALARTTHLGICAHQDDLEIAAYHGILTCFGQSDRWFTGVVVTDGAGSPRDNLYAQYTDDDMKAIRKLEQKKAAFVGEFAAQALLDHPSSKVKDREYRHDIEDLKNLLLAARPEVVYTHNLTDKHDTHLGTLAKTIAALRELPDDAKPKQVIGGEVWRDLDWLNDNDKVIMDVDGRDNLAAALLGVFDSQIAGGKRYDLATLGRRQAHATYFASHGVDKSTRLTFGMDLTPLIHDPSLDLKQYAQRFIDRFAAEVHERISKVWE